jgi:uncharacterized membrane protein YobD (UPF0266 family)
MGMFRKSEDDRTNLKNKNWIYTIKYNSFFETYKYPNPIDFLFGFLLILMLINFDKTNYDVILSPLGILIFIDIFFYRSSEGNKIILTQDAVCSNMWAKVSAPYVDIVSCEIKENKVLVINSKKIGNLYLKGLKLNELDRIKNIIDEKIYSRNVKIIENNDDNSVKIIKLVFDKLNLLLVYN